MKKVVTALLATLALLGGLASAAPLSMAATEPAVTDAPPPPPPVAKASCGPNGC